MSDWQRNATKNEHNDAMECGFYDLYLTALPVTNWSDRMGNGLLLLTAVGDTSQLNLMYEE